MESRKMAIPESINDLSVVAEENSPQGGDNIGGTLDDYLRNYATIMKRDLALKAAETAAGTSFTPTATILSKNVQAALAELAVKVNAITPSSIGALEASKNLSDVPNKATARSNLGLGSAATRNVGTSSGQLMEVGAFGLGGQFSSTALDANVVADEMGGQSGFYTHMSDLGSTNVPHTYVYLQNLVYATSGNYTQLAYSYNTDEMWIRHRYQNVWSSWAKFLTNNDTIPWSKITGAPSSFSRGMIMMWSGAVANIPAGWALCNGTNGTPDLRGRFVIGAGGTYDVGSTGNGSIPSHSHGAGTLATASNGAHTHTGSAASAGSHGHTGSAASAGAHAHTASSATGGAHTHTVSGTAASAGEHSHSTGIRSSEGSYSIPRTGYLTSGNSSALQTSTEGAHTHTVSGTAASAGGHAHTITVASGGAHTHSLSVDSGGAHTHTVSVTSAGAHTHTISGSTSASGSGSDVIARYYALCFIMKL